MTLTETPWLLIWWEESHYLEKFKNIFKENNKIIISETDKPIFIYTNKDKSIYHLWRWGWYSWLKEENFNFNIPEYYRRAQRILWIKYLLENSDKRKLFKDKNNWNICFVSFEMEFTVVLKELPKNFLLITSYHTYNPYRYMTKWRRFEEIKTL